MGYTTAKAKEFINEIGPIIQKVAKERGYKVASPVIAQAICESAAGTSSLGYRYHNYFGMKCGSSWKGKSVNLSTKEEYTVGTLTSIKANFRVYDTMEDGVNGYFDFINSKRYANLKGAETPEQYLQLIKADGYATSSSYVNTNMSIINKYDLKRFDAASSSTVATTNDCPYNEPLISVKLNTRGESAKWVQYMLNKKGANLKIDGVFGIRSVSALRLFQANYGLSTDGICGPKTRAKLKE